MDGPSEKYKRGSGRVELLWSTVSGRKSTRDKANDALKLAIWLIQLEICAEEDGAG